MQCTKCDKYKDAEEFYKSDNICRGCRKQINHEAYARRKKEHVEYTQIISEVLSRLEKLEVEDRRLKKELSRLESENHKLKKDLSKLVPTEVLLSKELKHIIDKRISKRAK